MMVPASEIHIVEWKSEFKYFLDNHVTHPVYRTGKVLKAGVDAAVFWFACRKTRTVSFGLRLGSLRGIFMSVVILSGYVSNPVRASTNPNVAVFHTIDHQGAVDLCVVRCDTYA